MLNPERIQAGDRVLAVTKADTGLPTMMVGTVSGFALWTAETHAVKTVNVPSEYPLPTEGGETTGAVFLNLEGFEEEDSPVAFDIAEVYPYDDVVHHQLKAHINEVSVAYMRFADYVNRLNRA